MGLATIHPGQPPQKLTPQLLAKVLEKTRQAPPDGSTHWSLRKMAAVMKVSKNLIARIWKEADLKPHRLERYMASNDPQFEEKAAAIIGLYLNPPQNAAVFCVDEKSAIQALDRLDRRLPLSPGRFQNLRHTWEVQTPEVFLSRAQPTFGIIDHATLVYRPILQRVGKNQSPALPQMMPRSTARSITAELTTLLVLSGERGRNRTFNLLIKSQLLCQLSYAPF